MDFQLTEDQIALRDLARSFATEVCAPPAAERDGGSARSELAAVLPAACALSS